MDLRNNVIHCTRCQKPLKNMKYFVSLALRAFKEKESGAWETLPPLDLTTNEVLCDDCFQAFTKLLIAGMAVKGDSG